MLYYWNIISTEKINNYSPIGQNQKFYAKSSFDIIPGSILGIRNTMKKLFEPNFSNQDLKNAKHIITFVEDEDIKTYLRSRNGIEIRLGRYT